jgi:hypothetical protein
MQQHGQRLHLPTSRSGKLTELSCFQLRLYRSTV